ncbi:MFS transporter [bacterium SCSIO 12643]|nr:MFS transporter [bacterium SCSIO 12643]
MEAPINYKKNSQFWLLCLSSALFFGSFNMMIPELPSYLESLGGGQYKGLIISLFTVTALLSRPFSGKLTDTIGRIPVMIFGASIGIIAGVLYPVLATVSGFFFLRLFHGLSTGFKPTATAAFVSDVVSSKERGEAMGILGVFTSSGMALGPMIGSFASDYIGINGLFYLSAFISFLSVAVIFGMQETLPNKQKMKSHLLKVKFHDFFERNVLPVAITFLLTTIPFGIILTLIPDLSDHLGISNRGSFYTVFVVSSISVRFFAGKFSDIYGRVPVLIVAAFLIGVSVSIISFADSQFWFYTGGVLFGLAAGMNGPTIFAWNIDRSSEEHRGRAMSTLYIFLEFGIGSGAAISGFIYNNDPGMFKYAFGFGALTAFIAMLYLISFQIKSMKNSTR